MKINKRIVLPSLVILLAAFIAFFFNTNNFSQMKMHMQDDTYNIGINRDSSSEISRPEESKLNTNFTNDIEPSKVITNIHISLETLEFNSTTKNINKIISEYNGYVENSNISQSSHKNSKIFKQGQYTIRIPKKNIDNFISDMDAIGNITSESTSKQDITKQYQDTESRLNLLNIKEERMLDLLKKADKIEDIITIENQLSDIIYQKENLTKNLIDMDDKISYSTVFVNISEVEKLTNEITTETNFGNKITNAISDSLYSFKIGLESFVIAFIYALPYLLVINIVVIVAYKIFNKRQNLK